jgi:predicted nucleotidyltransferase
MKDDVIEIQKRLEDGNRVLDEGARIYRGREYYFFNHVVERFREELEDPNITNAEVSYVLYMKDFPRKTITIGSGNNIRQPGIYWKSNVDDMFNSKEKREELKSLIHQNRRMLNDTIAGKLHNPKREDIQYLDKTEDEILMDIAKRNKERNNVNIKKVEIEEQPYYPEECDMDYVSKLLLNNDIYESEDLSDVDTDWTPKEGLFLEKDPKKIVSYLLRHSKDRGQAMKRLTFYMNRAGDNLKNKMVLNRAKKLLKESIKLVEGVQPTVIQGLENYTEQEICDIVYEYVNNTLEYCKPDDFRITGMRIIGSRTTGTARVDSDLDILLEYTGSIKEDTLFNILNDDGGLDIEGITIDINPITPGKSGTIQQFIERNKDYVK